MQAGIAPSLARYQNFCLEEINIETWQRSLITHFQVRCEKELIDKFELLISVNDQLISG
jgi:hypothetical protein